jgi:hypothetical protein
LFFGAIQKFRGLKMRGGKRAGAGRPRGSLTKKTQEIAIAAMAAGITPLELMLSVVQDASAPSSVRLAMAIAAAPYCHPRLAASVQATVTEESQITVVIRKFHHDDDDMVTANPAASGGDPKLIEHNPSETPRV